MINKLYPLGEGETIPEIKGVDPQLMREEEENCQDYGDEDEAIGKSTLLLFPKFHQLTRIQTNIQMKFGTSMIKSRKNS